MQKAIERSKEGAVRVIPIILRPCAWKQTPLGQIQALPTGDKPISSSENQDEAFLNIYQGIERVVEIIISRNKPLTYEFDSIYRQRDRVAEISFAGQNIGESFFNFLASFSAKQYDSCFLSYSGKDEAFAKRLYADLQNNGVRCWFAPQDIPPGTLILRGIDEAIRFHDIILLILSKQTVASGWVEHEVKTALTREQKENRMILFTVRLDDSIFEIPYDWAAEIRHGRNIGDFTHWKNYDDYHQALESLLKQLKTTKELPQANEH